MAQSKKSSNIDAIKKISIKQFQWFEVETKVRELLTELLQPFTKKQSEDTVKFNELKRNITAVNKKIQDHDFLLTKENAQKPTYIQMQDEKIANIEQKVAEIQAQQDKKISSMYKTIEIYEGKITQLNQLQSRVDQEIKERNSQFKEYKDHIDEQLDLMLKRLDSQDSQFNNLRQTTRNAVTKVQTKAASLETRVGGIEDELKRKTQQLQRIIDQLIHMNEKLAAVDLATKQLDVRLVQREKDYKLSEKFLSKTNEIQNDLSFIKNYLQYYQPLYNQMQISETINSFLKGSMKTRACFFEQKLFAHMHHAILTLEEDSLQTKMSDYSNRIRRIINRNKKYLIKLKVEQTIRYGNNVYEIRQADETLLDQGQDTAPKLTQVIVPQEEIVKIIDQKWQKMTKSLENTIDDKTSPFKIWIKQLQQQSLMREIQLQKKVSEIKSKIDLQQTNIQLLKTHLSEIEKQKFKSSEHLYRDIRKIKQEIKDIVNFGSVINHIVIQDQIDRQGMALYALRSNGKQENVEKTYPNVHIDDKCVSCQTGNSAAIVNQAFKMACLAYSPSEIKVQDRSFSRQEILEISTNILDKLKKKIEDIEIPMQKFTQKRDSLTTSGPRAEQKNRSRSVMSKQLNTPTQNKDMSTIDVPQSSRLRDTTYLLPILGVVKKKTSAISQRQKVNI